MSDEHDDSRPLGETVDLEAWTPLLPPPDFASRVLAEIQAEAPARPRRSRLVAIAAGGAGALALAAALALLLRPPASGEAIAKDRVAVGIGSRARAVLEPGAAVTWKGDEVVQTRGDVFYRVDRGDRFVVHTPAGDVEVLGTCFTVKVRSAEKEGDEMQKRDMKIGAASAALTALALVTVYEGKVAASHAKERVELAAGDSARLGPGGVTRAGADPDRELAAAVAGDDPTAKANQNLVRQVGEYRSRLEAIAQQKADLEVKLKRSEETLSRSRAGEPPPKHEFDLGAEEWKELAKDGTIKYQLPCIDPKAQGWQPSPQKLDTLGLAPQDGATLKAAYGRSSERLWAEIKDLCARAIGSAETASRIPPNTCIHLVLDLESARDPQGADAARKMVGEIRAGVRPPPAQNEALPPVARLFLATTGASKALEDDLAQSFGPAEAHRLVYSGELCMGRSEFGGSPPPRSK